MKIGKKNCCTVVVQARLEGDRPLPLARQLVAQKGTAFVFGALSKEAPFPLIPTRINAKTDKK